MNELTTLAAVEVLGSGALRNRGVNYHGNLGRVLRDLSSFTTLAFVPLQNAVSSDCGDTRVLLRGLLVRR